MGPWPITWWRFTPEYVKRTESIESPVMENIKTGMKLPLHDLPIGACYAAQDPSAYSQTGGDGQWIWCVVPDTTWAAGKYDWPIDGHASNCTNRADKGHFCWVRHGTIGDPLHVDKDGRTCAAGGGSIQTGSWHGFLHNGTLREDADPVNRGPK